MAAIPLPGIRSQSEIELISVVATPVNDCASNRLPSTTALYVPVFELAFVTDQVQPPQKSLLLTHGLNEPVSKPAFPKTLSAYAGRAKASSARTTINLFKPIES